MTPQARFARMGRPFAEPVRLLHMRVSGHDELGDAMVHVLLDEAGDLLVAVGQAGARAPRTRPTPAHRLGYTSRLRRSSL